MMMFQALDSGLSDTPVGECFHTHTSSDWHHAVSECVDWCLASAKLVLCLAVIGEVGACFSLITMYAVMESFLVDLTHSCCYCHVAV